LPLVQILVQARQVSVSANWRILRGDIASVIVLGGGVSGASRPIPLPPLKMWALLFRCRSCGKKSIDNLLSLLFVTKNNYITYVFLSIKFAVVPKYKNYCKHNNYGFLWRVAPKYTTCTKTSWYGVFSASSLFFFTYCLYLKSPSASPICEYYFQFWH